MKDRRCQYLGKKEVKRKVQGSQESFQVLIYLIKMSLTTFSCQFMGSDFFKSCYRRANGVENQSSTEKKEEIIKKEDSMDLKEKDNLKSILRKSTDNESVMKKVTYADAVKSTMWE